MNTEQEKMDNAIKNKSRIEGLIKQGEKFKDIYGIWPNQLLSHLNEFAINPKHQIPRTEIHLNKMSIEVKQVWNSIIISRKESK